MQDVVGYLFLQRYFYEEGDAGRGRRVYEEKGCAGCHEGRRETGAPDLTGMAEAYTPITMTSSVWRHGASMGEPIRRRGGAWPQFQGDEMTNLLAYLNSRLRPQIARP
jgi:mono/diheme cytochrome c family protein